jgi:hypothetical protein
MGEASNADDQDHGDHHVHLKLKEATAQKPCTLLTYLP